MTQKGVLIALTNPVDGREDEYNDWYNNIHIPDVLAIPGFVGATRYRVADGQHVDGPKPWKYVAVYNVECDDIGIAANELGMRVRTERLRVSTALQEKRNSWFFEEIFAVEK